MVLLNSSRAQAVAYLAVNNHSSRSKVGFSGNRQGPSVSKVPRQLNQEAVCSGVVNLLNRVLAAVSLAAGNRIQAGECSVASSNKVGYLVAVNRASLPEVGFSEGNRLNSPSNSLTSRVGHYLVNRNQGAAAFSVRHNLNLSSSNNRVDYLGIRQQTRDSNKDPT